MYKKTTTLSLFVLLPLVLAGCGAGESVAPTPSAVTVVTGLPTSMPTAEGMAVGILPTPTPRPHPPTPTLAPTSAPPPTAVGPAPTETARESAPGTAQAAIGTPTPELAPDEMVSVPAGEFVMGTTSEDERPPHSVAVGAFEVDKFEVTNEAFQRFVDATGYQTEAEQADEASTWRDYAEGEPRHPVVKVTWNDAQAYCQWAEKRLPTEAEWEKAARSTEELVYPWGDTWDSDKANTRESGFRGTTVVGSFPQGASPYGAMDMAGNVAEWTSDWYEAYPGSDFSSPYFGQQYRVIRGGGWFSDQEQVRTTARSASSEELRNDDVGFRCARSQ